ncbi:hypothetical protein P2H44_11665 [Albimonas sp. CAU 1670]|uniref:hypothetical protein n=1 Tax=Albimonas sp. CAU 1670 TaxID=3032599 RepID=UPI0023DA5BF7|nr:hypothetical protein [Albimonas sp. CAU 1670]MDF2233210.1 hypothetical protein [Albimonas sp. CAU 1670]
MTYQTPLPRPSYLSDLLALGEAGHLAVANWPASRLALHRTAALVGRPLAAIAADPALLDDVPRAARPGAFLSSRDMAAWRGALLGVFEAAGLVDACPWARLRRLARVAEEPQHRINGLYKVERLANESGLASRDLDRAWALDVNDRLDGHARATFRLGVAALDAWRQVAAIRASGLLPEEPLGPMPKIGEDCVWARMRAAARRAGEREQLNHISHLKRRADEHELAPRDLTQAWIDEVDGGLEGRARSQFRQGVRRLLALQGLPGLEEFLPGEILRCPGEWAVVRQAARDAGICGFESYLSLVKGPADRAGLRLPELDHAWASATHDAMPDQAARSAFRVGLRGLDVLRALLPDQAARLPREPLAVGPLARQRQRCSQLALWEDLAEAGISLATEDGEAAFLEDVELDQVRPPRKRSAKAASRVSASPETNPSPDPERIEETTGCPETVETAPAAAPSPSSPPGGGSTGAKRRASRSASACARGRDGIRGSRSGARWGSARLRLSRSQS